MRAINSLFVGLTVLLWYDKVTIETVPLFALGVLIGACSSIGAARFPIYRQNAPFISPIEFLVVAVGGRSVFLF